MDSNLRTKIGLYLAAGAAVVAIILAGALPGAADSDPGAPLSSTTAEPIPSPESESASASSDDLQGPASTSSPTSTPRSTSPVAERNAHGSGW